MKAYLDSTKVAGLYSVLFLCDFIDLTHVFFVVYEGSAWLHMGNIKCVTYDVERYYILHVGPDID